MVSFVQVMFSRFRNVITNLASASADVARTSKLSRRRGGVVMQARRVVVAALAGLAAFASPARADTAIKSEDSSVEITVPNGWRQTKTASPKIQIQATNGRAVILVRVAAKEDYRDFKSFAAVGSDRFIKKFVDAEPKTEDVQVNGNPAIRVSAEGTEANGKRRGFVITFIDTGGMFVEVIGIANASTFGAEQQTMADLAGRVKVLAAGGTGPAAQAPPAAPAPVTTPPASTSPPSNRPPVARSPR
jgi:hypothetical protein